ncbi:MAG: hypothetical protein IJD79_10640 [Clostridia bacterium]|nr:hypothetical protein [Clostridia bacterium]
MLLLYIFVIVMLFSSVPYLVAMTKKASAAANIKRALEQAGCKFIPVNPIWYMGSISGKYCDFYIIFDGRVIAVKTVSFISSNVFIEFTDENNYGIKAVRSKTELNASSVILKNCKKRPYDFKSKLPKEATGLPLAKVILLNDPLPVKVTQKDEHRSVDVHPGDRLPEGDYHTIDSFLYLFK